MGKHIAPLLHTLAACSFQLTTCSCGAMCAQACKQWMGTLSPLVGSGGGSLPYYAFPTRNAPTNVSAAAITTHSPRSMSGSSAALSTPRPGLSGATNVGPVPQMDALQVGTALRRGWHVNTGQAGLAKLKRIGAPRPLPGIPQASRRMA